MKQRGLKIILGALLTPVMVFSAWPAIAQTQLEEVLVTARKQEESLQKVPAAVTAVGADMIEALQLRSVDDVARFTPGFSFSKAFGRSTERPVVRGLSNVLANVRFGVEAGAAYFLDGVYYPGNIQSLDLYDVERVEVVRGPQSALYGRNTYSGAINFVTRTAQPDAWTGGVRIALGQNGTRDLSLRGSGPLMGDMLSGGFQLRDHEYDGEWKNLVTGDTIGDESTTSFSGNLNWQLERTKVRVRFQDNSDEDGTRPFFLQPRAENNCYPIDAAIKTERPTANDFLYFCGALKERPIALNDGDAATAEALQELITDLGYNLDTNLVLSTNPRAGVHFSGVERDLQVFSLLAEHELQNGHKLVLATSLREEETTTGSDSDHSPVNIFIDLRTFAPRDEGQESSIGTSDTATWEDMSLEFRWESPQDKALRWRAGYFYFSQDQETEDTSNSADFDGNRINESTLENTSLFASVSYDFAPQWSVDFEIRRQDEEKEQIDYQNPPPGVFGVPLTLPEVTYDDEGEWDNTTPRLTLSYLWDDDTTLYGIYAEGVKPGGLNGSAGQREGLPTYEQEESSSWEGGLKRVWRDGTVITNLAMYFTEITDLQGTETVAGTGATNASVAANKGEGEVFGFEAELRWLISDGMDLSVNYALADTEFTEGCDETQFFLTSGGGHVAAPGNDEPYNADNNPQGERNPNGSGDCSIKGNQFAFAPKHSASVVWNYRRALDPERPSVRGGGAVELLASVDWSYESKKYVQVHNGAYTDAYNLLGARIGLREAAGAWTLMLFGKNLTDADEPIVGTRWISPYYNTNRGRWFFANPRPERHIGVEFSYSF